MIRKPFFRWKKNTKVFFNALWTLELQITTSLLKALKRGKQHHVYAFFLTLW